MGDATEGLAEVRQRIVAAEKSAGREDGSVRLIAVSKTFDAEAIRPVIAAGQRDFGENRVQEAQAKWPALKAETPDVTLHLIGPLQSNKAADAVALFDAIHTIDRDRIAEAVAREMKKQGRALRLLVQVNTGEEPQKAGVAPADVDAFVARCRDVHGLAVDGLMCIPPADQVAAPHFALMAKIAKHIARVVNSTTNEPVCGTIKAIATSSSATIRIFMFWVIGRRSVAAEQAGRLDRQDENHRSIEREVGDFRKQRLAEIVGEADQERADRGAAKRAHAADDDDRKGQRQHFEIEAGVDAEEGAAGHAAERGEEGAEREDEHRDAVGVDADAARHLRVVDGGAHRRAHARLLHHQP